MANLIGSSLCALACMSLVACGGGGGGAAPSASILTLPPPNYGASSAASTTTYTITGTCQGTSITVKTATQPATFEGVPGYLDSGTTTRTLTNCQPVASTSTRTNYYGSTYLPLGYSNSGTVGYAVVTNWNELPTQVRVGDAGERYVRNVFLDSSKLLLIGRDVFTYVIEVDADGVPILNLVEKQYDIAGQLTLTAQTRYRIGSTGSVSFVNIDLQYSGASTSHLIYTRTNAGQAAPI